MSIGVTVVTGATGFAGSHLLDRLAGLGPLVGWCRPGGHRPDPASAVRWQAVDLTDSDEVARAIDESNPARIFHLAGAPNVANSWDEAVFHLRINAMGTHHLLEAVRASGRPCRVLVVSSAQIYHATDDPIGEDAPLGPSNPYGLSKLAQDQFAIRAAIDDGLDVVVARPFNHIGPRQSPGFAVPSFARQIARIESGLEVPVIKVGNLDARRDITDVRDIVDAYAQLMESAPAGRVYNVCSGRAWRIRDLLDELLHLSPAAVRIDVDPARLRPLDVPIVQGNATRIRSEVGWTPRIPVERTLEDTLQWWRAKVVADL